MLSYGAQFKGIYEPLIKLRSYNCSWGKNDNEALQMRYGMIGLISYYQRKNGLNSILDTDESEWQRIKIIFDYWFEKQGFKNKIQAKYILSSIRQKIMRRQFSGILCQLTRLIRIDPSFWLYKGIGFNYPNQIESFLVLLNNNLDSNK